MSRIDAPLLDRIYLRFFYQPIIDVPQLPPFMHRSEIFKPPYEVDVFFADNIVRITLLPLDSGYFYLEFQCVGLYRQLSLLKHIFVQCLPLLSHVSQLNLNHIQHYDLQIDGQDAVSWLGFLRLFNAVQILDVSGSPLRYYLVIHFAHVLEGLTSERAAEVLPMLHTLLLNGFEQVGHLVTPLLKPFIDAPTIRSACGGEVDGSTGYGLIPNDQLMVRHC